MQDETGRYHLVFNGEIYNYRELRDELIGLGWSFRTATDSEVLLKAYMAWNRSALDRLLGMFAFAIWDDRDKTMFVARDRFAIKPMYFFKSDSGVAFGSEIKQLLKLGGTSARMNPERMRDFLVSGILDHTEETLFDGIRQLRGGECAVLSSRAGGALAMRIDRWYRIPADRVEGLSEEDAGERFRELLQEAVRLHLRSDVPVGSCLSGGLDSSSLVCLMTELLEKAHPGLPRPHDLRLFRGEGGRRKAVHRPRRETNRQRAAACLSGGSGRFRPCRENHLAPGRTFRIDLDLRPVVRVRGSQARRAHGDAGRPGRRRADRGVSRGLQLLPSGAARSAPEGRAGKDGLGASLRTRHSHLAAALRPPAAPRWGRGCSVSYREGRWGRPLGTGLDSESMRGLPPLVSVLDHAVDRLRIEPVTDLRTLCMAMTFAISLPALLHYEDRDSMAHGIEGRVPFLDHRLVEFVLSLGTEHKIRHADTKRVMRRAMKGVLPEMVRNRRDKLGFSTPEEIWFKGVLKEKVKEGVEDTLKLYPELLDAGETRLLVDDYLEGRRPFDFTPWRIVNVGIWGRVMGVSM